MSPSNKLKSAIFHIHSQSCKAHPTCTLSSSRRAWATRLHPTRALLGSRPQGKSEQPRWLNYSGLYLLDPPISTCAWQESKAQGPALLAGIGSSSIVVTSHTQQHRISFFVRPLGKKKKPSIANCISRPYVRHDLKDWPGLRLFHSRTSTPIPIRRSVLNGYPTDCLLCIPVIPRYV